MTSIIALGRRGAPVRLLISCAACLSALAGCGGGGGGASSGSSVFSAPASMALAAVYPVRGSAAGGQQVTLTGQGFSAGMQVTIGGQACTSLAVASPTSATCLAPAHAQGSVDVQADAGDGSSSVLAGAYTYRPSGLGVQGFGIVGTAPAPGVRPAPFSVALESAVAGFDLASATRSWTVDGQAYHEGDSVPFAAGSHTVTVTLRDATGDTDQASYTVVVGAMPAQAGPGLAVNSFPLVPGDAIAMRNTGLFPVLNPRFIGAGKPDYVDWSRYLNSVAQLAGVPSDASESSRAALLVAAWKDLSNTTQHVCSPGREGENIYDPALLLRGYGYECCSEASRGLGFLGSFLDLPARVRTTQVHEFPEFTVGGQMFVLDPDMRFRFWGDNQLPLSAWTTDTTPVSLMNVQHYFAETPLGGYYDVQAGGTLPFDSSSAFPEATLRSFYTDNIVAETILGYDKAWTSADYVVNPGEQIAFGRTSAYVPLQRLNADGTPTGDVLAPAVGQAVFRRVWSADGPRAFQQDGSGNHVLPLGDLPFPVQDLVFHFGKPVDPQTSWLTSGGNVYRIGTFAANTWTVSAQQLRAFASVSDLAAVVPHDQDLVSVDIGMQFNPGIYGDPASAVPVGYADDSGDCQHRVTVTSSGGTQDAVIGASLCDAQAPQRAEADYDLADGQPGVAVISDYGNSYQGSWGLDTPGGVRGYAEIALPRTPGLPGLLRATDGGFFADWSVYDGSNWVPASTTDVQSSQWIVLPATTSSTTRLRLTLRQAPAVDVTYLSALSVIEGRNPAQPAFVTGTVAAQAAPTARAAGGRRASR